jgi:aerobic carbon-monoxide dehydrogenase large subunit
MVAASLQEIGAARRRVEDPRLIQGAGQYVDDLRLPGTVDVAFVRSAYAHARIKSVDLEAARRAPGVLAAWSGEHVRDTPRVPNRLRIEGARVSPLPALARDLVTLMGYPVAAVVAGDRYLARDAADLVEVDYEPLPAVTSAERALESDAPIIYPQFGTNVAYRVVKEGGDPFGELRAGSSASSGQAVDGAFSRADHTLSLRLAHSRVAQVPMEPRGILASYARQADLLTVWRSTQSPFLTRNLLSAVLGRPEESIRVIAPDVGGAFGSKSALYPDEMVVVLLAMELGAPVRWISTRMEDLQLTIQGRDQVNLVEAAFTGDGIITGLKVRTLFNVGGVLMHPFAAPPLRVTDYATGAYRIGAYRVEALGVYTNTSPTGPYRGAGRPEAGFIAERTIEEVGRTLGLDPIEVRRRNFIRPNQFPYKTPVGSTYDSGNYELALDRALEIAGYERLREQIRRERQALAGAQGFAPAARRAQRGAPQPLRGIGIATTIEVSAQGSEFGSIEVEPDGSIVARTGSSSHGQGHETSFAQVVADRLGVPFERVRVLHGDTAETPIGSGTGGSRSMVLGGSALAGAAEGVQKKALRVAASLLETSADDLVYAKGGVEVVGAPERCVGLDEIARSAAEGIGLSDGERGLKDDHRFQPGGDAVPFGAAIAVVGIDRDTGRVSLERLVVVDDCGTAVNPLIVEGQVAGGLAQGIGEALYERVVFDDDGQLLTASLLDYAVPTAPMVPDYELDLTVTPSPNNPLGAKGIGESGCVSAPPAIVNAVLDALAPLGISNLEMPLTSDRIWRAIREAEQKR